MELNILLLWLYKKAILHAIGATFHDNPHFFVAKLPDISFLVKYMTNDSIFNEKLDRIGIQNNTTIFAFLNLFYTRAAYLLNVIALS